MKKFALVTHLVKYSYPYKHYRATFHMGERRPHKNDPKKLCKNAGRVLCNTAMNPSENIRYRGQYYNTIQFDLASGHNTEKQLSKWFLKFGVEPYNKKCEKCITKAKEIVNEH